MGVDFCKEQGKRIAAEGGDDKEYKGLAVIIADQISYGIKAEPHEPPDSEASKKLTEMTQGLFKLAVYHPDPNPTGPTWTGAPL
jgi:hypothetical protein